MPPTILTSETEHLVERLFDRLHRMTARPFVELTIPPHEGELDSWGKDPRGQWWGLVIWFEDVVQSKQMGRSTVLPCSGWVAARHLRKKGDEDYSGVLRLVLPEDDSLWPEPTDRGPHFWWSDKAHHVGILTGALQCKRYEGLRHLHEVVHCARTA